MKGLKKKIAIALLAATCLTAGAFGLSACGKTDVDKNSTLYTIYLSETNNGETLTYEQWLLNKLSTPSNGQTPFIGENGNWWIGETDTGVKAGGADGENGNDGRGIKSINTIDGEFVVFYTDGTCELIEEADDLPFKLLKVYAKDQTNAPVANAYLQLYYYNSSNYTSQTIGTAVTDSNGVAKFLYVPEDGISYRVSLADQGKTEYDPALPDGYSISYNIDPVFNWAITYFEVTQTDGILQTLNLPFQDVSHSFVNANLHGKIVRIPYTRVYSDTAEGNAVEENGTQNNQFTVDVKAGYHTYVSFLSYVNPETSSDKEETQRLLDNATNAATGKYEFTITGGSNPILYFYEGNSGNMPSDERGIPKYIISHTGDATDNDDEVATGTNSLTINIDTTSVRGEIFFGVYSASDCTVTLTVERTGDAEEIPEPELISVSAPTNLTKWANRANGETLTLMPVTGAYTVVKGTDGYYHVNSANGPILTVMLTKAVARYLNDVSLQSYPASSDRGESVLHFNPADIDEYYNKDKRYPLKKYDYNAVLTEYCKWVNSDGVYGVDDTMYTLLTSLASMAVGIEFTSAADGCQWLLPCYYYSPEGGLAAPGSGTSSDPYIVSVGENKIAMTGLGGTAQLKLNVSSAGVYEFETTCSGTLSVSGYTTATVNGILYVLIPEAGELTFTISGIAANYTLSISEGDALAAFVGSGSSDDAPSQGIDADTAISIMGIGVWSVLDDKETNDGIYINFACIIGGDGNYTLSVYGDSGATLTYGDTTASSITIDARFGAGNVVYIQASQTANLMLVITKV